MDVVAPAGLAGRELLIELYDAAVAAAAPGPVTARAIDALSIDRASRVWVFAFGKAAVPMASAAVTSLLRSLHAIVGGVVVSGDANPAVYPTLATMRGDHPIPGRNSFAAAAKIAEVTPGRRGNDVAVVLISGGASSLIGAPLRGMNEADLTSLYELLLGSGLDIAAVNSVRKRFTRWGAGRLALALAPAATHCLAMSDVADDDLSVIGSGPCVPDTTTVRDVTAILERAKLMTKIPQTHRDYLASVARGTIPETPTKTHPAFAHVTARVIGNNRSAVEGAAARGRASGMVADVMSARLSGSAAQAGENIARELLAARTHSGVDAPKHCLVWGGETTVALGGGGTAGARASGGGRCQELALAAARILSEAGENAAGITLLAGGTDGRDGMTDASGAVVDSTTWRTIADAGRDPAQALAAHESNGVLRMANALLPRRETGTNVNDVVIGVV
jgi:hydroxypyruvate reductase